MQQGLINGAITFCRISRISDGRNDGKVILGGRNESRPDPSTFVTFANVGESGLWKGSLTESVDGANL